MSKMSFLENMNLLFQNTRIEADGQELKRLANQLGFREACLATCWDSVELKDILNALEQIRLSLERIASEIDALPQMISDAQQVMERRQLEGTKL